MVDHEYMLQFAEAGHRVLNKLLALNSPVREELVEENRAGGYLCVADMRGEPIMVIGLGDFDPERRALQFEFCQEKVARLAQFPSHRRSMESRNKEAGQYGGALRGDRFLASFSGFPEGLDEVIAGIALCRNGNLTFTQLSEILSDNEYVARLGENWLFGVFQS